MVWVRSDDGHWFQRCDRAAGQSFDGLLQVLFGEAGLGGAFHDVGESVGSHPVVVEDLLHIAAAGIGHQHHDELVFVEVVLAGVFQRGEHGHAG